MGYLKLPEGKRIAVNLGVDVDAQSLWLGIYIDRRHPLCHEESLVHKLAYQGF